MRGKKDRHTRPIEGGSGLLGFAIRVFIAEKQTSVPLSESKTVLVCEEEGV